MTTAPETTASTTPCPKCGEPVAVGANFCEACGTQLGTIDEAAAASLPREGADEVAPVSRPTSAAGAHVGVPEAPPRTCLECGGTIDADGYCETCGAKAPSERDHFAEQPAPWVAGVCDRGMLHPRNEDAMALWADQSRAVMVVCDGVSSSSDSDVASLAGAQAALAVLSTPLPSGIGTDASRLAAVTHAFTDAVTAANNAIVRTTEPTNPNPASATFTATVTELAEGGRATIWHANVGDSRSYWIPDDGEPAQITVDDSGAQLQIAAGVAREVAENSAEAHGITKWLGRDGQDHSPTVGRLDVTGPGWVLTCSDGLWNYASAAPAMAARLHEYADIGPADMAQALVTWANQQGGRDNITAAVARLGPIPGASGNNVTAHDLPSDVPDAAADEARKAPIDG